VATERRDAFDPDRITRYNELVAEEASRLDGALADIRRAEAASNLTAREAADNRISVLEANLNRLRLLRAEYLQ
jgi:acyl CoA:acetate/3-ketoacid CoA transferase alpha subunit